jgi:hypothetical protein
MASEAGTRDWADLKARADGPTYDSMLKLFMKTSEQMSKSGDTVGVRAMEVLALSLVARRQEQADLEPGVGFLDTFIKNCGAAARRRGATFLPIPPATRQ